MDWSRIKTIFIISFLLLDIYLAYQFLSTRNEAQYELLTEASIEERLRNNEIEYKELPKELGKEPYISVKPKILVEKESLLNQVEKAKTNDGTRLTKKLDKPIKLTGKFNAEDFAAAVLPTVQSGDQYQFWEKDDEEKTITFFQQYNGKPVYHNLNGKLVFSFNEKNEIISYEQTYLEFIEELSEDQEVITPLAAIETLLKNGLLQPKSKITKVEPGYSTLVQLTASQVLAPTWRIEVNGEENLFVHAFEGQVIQFSNKETEVTE